MSTTTTVADARRPPKVSLRRTARPGLLAGGMYHVLPELLRANGDVIDLSVPGFPLTALGHPDLVAEMMVRHQPKYRKHELAIELVAGEPLALPLLEGDEWRRVRLALNPHFTERSLAKVTGSMVEALTRHVDGWHDFVRDDQWIDLESEIATAVMAGMLAAMFHSHPESRLLDDWVASAHQYGAYVVRRVATTPLPAPVARRVRGEKAGLSAMQFMMAELDKMIAERLASPRNDEPDILDVVLAMDFPGKGDYPYRRMRSELMGLVFAGFETTAEALSWTFAYLGRNPAELLRAYEVVDTLGGNTPTYADLPKLKYLRNCFDEAQRLQGAIANVRTARVEDEIGGYRIPTGSHVVFSPIGLQMDSRFWRSPESFIPERFDTDEINYNAFIPFSLGARKCMGSKLAYIEGVLTLAIILQRFRFQLRPGWNPKPALRVSTGLKKGLPVRLTAVAQ